jgi:hypothetical protein
MVSMDSLFDLGEAPVEQVRPIMAAQTWPSNADLIADVARFGYLQGEVVIDVTYGRGTWWNRYRPHGPEFLDRYGLTETIRPDDLRALITDGIREAFRVLRVGGRLLMKGQNFTNSGRYQTFAYESLRTAEQAGFRLEDEFVHLRHPGPRPPSPRQYHARRNYSILFVLAKARRA